MPKTKKKAPAKKKAAQKRPRKVAAPKPAADAFETLVEEARAAAQEKMRRAVADYGLGSYEGFNVDQTRGVIEFVSGGKVVVSAHVLFAGSLGTETGTWMWSWANDSILPAMKDPVAKVKKLGHEPLLLDAFPADEGLAWSMAAIAAHVLGSECIYRVPTRSGFTWLLLSGLKRA